MPKEKEPGIDIEEQKDDNRPWKGTVRFRIDSAMREPDGGIARDSIKKTFNYVYDIAPDGRSLWICPGDDGASAIVTIDWAASLLRP